MSDGYWTLPCRLVLPVEQRERLERLCRARELDVNDLASEIVLAYLEEVPDEALAEPMPEPYRPSLAEQLRQHEREWRRLRMRRSQLGDAAPGWLASYMTDIEQEIAILREKIAAEAQQ